jgi:hypothetical protein
MEPTDKLAIILIIKVAVCIYQLNYQRSEYQGRIQGGGGGGAPGGPPLKLKKIWFYGVKSWFLTRNTPKYFAPSSTRRNFFKCAPGYDKGRFWPNLRNCLYRYNIKHNHWKVRTIFFLMISLCPLLLSNVNGGGSN